jgi:hypothetical protein
MLRRNCLTYLIAVFALVLMSGCAARVSYRTYDPYYRDYHVWSDAELPYYNNWVIETHRPNVEFRRLREPDRREYWRWRHDHR